MTYTEQVAYNTALKDIERLKKDIERLKDEQWISVKDRLPDKDGFYLAWYTFTDGGHACDIFYHNCCGISISSAITHWMPLPEPPKENSDGY